MSKTKPKSRLEALKGWMMENKFPKMKLTTNQIKTTLWNTEKI